MQTNNLFSTVRFVALCKHSLTINKRVIWITLGGSSVILFFLLYFLQASQQFSDWTNYDYYGVFAYTFFPLGILFSGLSFPAFRNKEKSMAYLMLPVSQTEKYLFEFLTRILLFTVIIPPLFWVVANLEGAVVKNFAHELVNYRFSFGEAWSKLASHDHFSGWTLFAMVQGWLFTLLLFFTGASHFSRMPFQKTWFSFGALFFGYTYFIVVLGKVLGLQGIVNIRLFFFKTNQSAIAALAIAITVINLCLLAISWFRLKEKEA
jgi:hypothetical protein